MVYVRIISGEIAKKTAIKMMATDKTFEVLEVGIFHPKAAPVDILRPGEVGYLVASIKKTSDVKIGDTITAVKHPAKDPLPASAQLHPLYLREFIPLIPLILSICAMRLSNYSSTIPLSMSSRRAAWR